MKGTMWKKCWKMIPHDGWVQVLAGVALLVLVVWAFVDDWLNRRRRK
jgi:hypothetical protein